MPLRAAGTTLLQLGLASHVACMQVAVSFKAHEKNVRALAYDSQTGSLFTGSFDRTVKVFRAAQAQTAAAS